MLKYCNDLHVHTNLSVCAPRDSYASNYIPYCKEENVKVLGFVNHVYNRKRMAEEHPEFKGTPGEYPLLIRDEVEGLKAKNKDIKILLGCEAETVYNGEFLVSHEESKLYDYVFLAPSHICNMLGEYDYLNLDTPDKLRDFMLMRFKDACKIQLAVPTAICHPLYPIGSPFEQEVVDGITELELEECFKLAKENNKAIEVHACLFRKGTKHDDDGISPSYLRMLSVAKECGCKFFLGTDAHSVDGFLGTHAKLLKACDYLGIGEDDLWEVGRI